MNKLKKPIALPIPTIILGIFCVFFSFILLSPIPNLGEKGEENTKTLLLFDRIYKGEGNPPLVNIEKIGEYTLDLLSVDPEVKVDPSSSFFGEGSAFPNEEELIKSREYASYDRIGYGYLHYFEKDNVRLYIYELRIFNRKKKKFFSYCTFFKWPHAFKPAVEKLIKQVLLPSCSIDKSTVMDENEIIENNSDKKISVLIDPGHGGKNLGAELPKSLFKYDVDEKDLNSQIARLTGDRLEKMGFAVSYTRLPEEDYFLSLNERAVICNIFNPDLFISLHHDGGNPESRGFRLFYSDYKPLADVEDLEIFLQNKLESNKFMGEILIDDLSHLFYRGKDGKITYTTSKLSNWDVLDKTLSSAAIVSRDLGTLVVDNFVKELSYVKPHPKKGNSAIASAYFVLRKTRCPSILIENGYMTTPEEFLNVRKPENQRLFAKSLTNSIYSYYYPEKPLPFIEDIKEKD